MTKPFVINNARIVDPATNRDSSGAVLVENGRITGIAEGAPQGVPDGAEVYDAKGLVVAPGLIDMRVFTGEPGHEYRETLATRRRSRRGRWRHQLRADARHRCPWSTMAPWSISSSAAPRDTAKVNILPAAAITKGLRGEEITEFGLLKEAGAVCLTDGRNSIQSAGAAARRHDLRRQFRHADRPPRRRCLAGRRRRDERGRAGHHLRPQGHPARSRNHPPRPRPAARRRSPASATTRRRSRPPARSSCWPPPSAGATVSAGISINNLALNENDVAPYRTFFKLSPPLRSEDDRRAMIEGLKSGAIDVIHSAHDPQDTEVKRQPFAEASEGAIGLETLLAAALRLVHSGDVPLLTVLRAMTSRPAEILGLDSGRLAVGAPADLIIFDPDFPWVVTEDDIVSRSRNTAFEGARMQGAVMHTFVAGKPVFSHAATREGAHDQLRDRRHRIGYLLGSIPFGLLITRAAGLGDVRKIGSGNIGATNVLRTGSRELAAATLRARCAQGHRRRAARPLRPQSLFGAPKRHRRLHRLCRRRRRLLRPLSSRSGSASRAARASPTMIGVLLGLAWLVGADLLRRLAADRLRPALSRRSRPSPPRPRRRSSPMSPS